MKQIAISCLKGGVGKSTISINRDDLPTLLVITGFNTDVHPTLCRISIAAKLIDHFFPMQDTRFRKNKQISTF